jgi:fatty-acyl-CoA synthase
MAGLSPPETALERPVSKTLCALIEEMAARHPQRPAVSFQGRTVSFAEFRRLTLDCAKALHAQGVQPGDKVGILMGNRIEWLVANFAAQYVGATMVALNTWYTQRELAYVLEHSDVSVLLASDRFLRADYVEMLQALQPWSRNAPLLRTVVLLGDRQVSGFLAYESFLAAGAAVGDEKVLALAQAVRGDDIAYLLYTSGSTAHPKGVLLYHRHLVENMFDIGQRMHWTADDVVYMPLSLFWGMGCMNMLIGPWTHGMHIVLQEQFDARDGLELIQKYRCSVLAGTANIIHAIFEHPERANYDLSSMQGGTPLGSPETSLQIIRTVMPLGVRVYGLTETHGFCTMHDAGDPVDKRARNDGRVMPGFQLRIVSPETGLEVGRGEAGEVRLKGRLLAGYYKNPEATADSYDLEGWFKTGDVGMLDAEGYLTFMGRYKEMLKTGGINVAPIEVEEVLLKHPAVREAFVTGLPDPVREQVVAAVIVLKEGAAASEEDLLQYCRAQLAAYKVPRHLRFVTMEQLPQTTTGKVHRLRLHTLFEAAPAH